MFEISILNLKSDLELRPSRSLILGAGYLMMTVTRDLLPDWVECLANGDPSNWESVLDETLIHMKAEEKSLPAGAQYGRSIPEYGFFLMVAVIVCGLLYAWLAPFVGMAVAGVMSEVASNITYDQPSTHAILKHGPAATAVQECIGRKGIYQQWTNPSNGRQAQLCQLDDGRWGLNIIESDSSPVTTFIKDKMSDISQVFQYLRNCGYIHPNNPYP